MSPTTRMHLAASAVWMVGAFESRAQSYHLRGIGHLDNVQSYSEITALSGNGEYAVGTSSSSDGFAAFRWSRDTGIQRVPLPPGWGRESIALDVSADGGVVVGQAANARSHSEAFVWEEGTGPRGLGLAPNEFSEAKAVSADGTVVVGLSGNVSPDVVIWDADGVRNIGRHVDFVATLPKAVSNDTLIVGYGFLENADTHEFFWVQERGFESWFSDDFLGSRANDVSADGAVVVGAIKLSEGWRAYRRSGKSFTLLDPLLDAVALAVSHNGQFAVGSLTDGARSHAFIWSKTHGVQPIEKLLLANGVDLGGWKLLYATGVSDAGHVIGGFGVNPSNAVEGWVLEVVAPRAATEAALNRSETRVRP